MRRMRFATAAILLLLVASLAIALDLDTVAGAWSNVVGAPGTFVTVGNETQVRWGTPASPGGQSGVGFTPNAALPVLELALGEEFEIGMLRHFNNPIFAPAAKKFALLRRPAAAGSTGWKRARRICGVPGRAGTAPARDGSA